MIQLSHGNKTDTIYFVSHCSDPRAARYFSLASISRTEIWSHIQSLQICFNCWNSFLREKTMSRWRHHQWGAWLVFQKYIGFQPWQNYIDISTIDKMNLLGLSYILGFWNPAQLCWLSACGNPFPSDGCRYSSRFSSQHDKQSFSSARVSRYSSISLEI